VAIIPMFPLGSVLLPGMVIPLHVFEPRYQRLVQDCVDAPAHEFGIVLIDRGNEVGGGDSRSDVGVVAMMLQVAQLDDGRYAVVAVGTRRIRVLRWLDDNPYPIAEIEDWPDGDADVADGVIEALAAKARSCAGLAVEMGDRSGVPEIELSGDPSTDSYLIAALAPLGPADQYGALCAADAAARLGLIDGMLDDVFAALRFRLG
jgi:uncharacterized protein